MDPKLQKAIQDVARYARLKNIPDFLLGMMFRKYDSSLPEGQRDGTEIIIHREHLTTKQALMIAIQSVHTVIDWELSLPGLSVEETKVLSGFKDDMNKLVKATDKALIAAQKKAGKKE